MNRSVLLTVALSTLASACSHGDSPSERQMTEMRASLTRIQADHDRLEQRLSVVEVSVSELDRPAPAGGPSRDVARARVVHVGPPGDDPDRTDGDTDDPDPRPVVAAQGGASSRGEGRRAVVYSPTEGGAAEPAGGDGRGKRPSALDPDARKAYESALAQVRNKEYDAGIEAFAAYLQRWPDHPYADNAAYWRGQAFYAKGDMDRAAEQLEALVARPRTGNKVSDALLLLSRIYERKGDRTRARAMNERLQREFPSSDAAKRASPPKEK